MSYRAKDSGQSANEVQNCPVSHDFSQLCEKKCQGMLIAPFRTMIATAVYIFLGLSACMTLSLVAAVAVGARRSAPTCQNDFETAISLSPAESTNARGNLVRAYGH
jgi:hypothetical protein